MNDIEIARSVTPRKIIDLAKKLEISDEYIEQYGKYKAKILNKVMSDLNERKNAKLVLVTAINPTPLGEGKTTISIGLADALNKLDKKFPGESENETFPPSRVAKPKSEWNKEYLKEL